MARYHGCAVFRNVSASVDPVMPFSRRSSIRRPCHYCRRIFSRRLRTARLIRMPPCIRSPAEPVTSASPATARSTFPGFRSVHEQIRCTPQWPYGESHAKDHETLVGCVCHRSPTFSQLNRRARRLCLRSLRPRCESERLQSERERTAVNCHREDRTGH